MEKRNRIRIALFAYAYEIMNDPLISDTEYDTLSLKIKTEINTDNPIIDKFFREDFSAHTGMWIYKHPDVNGIASLYQRITGKQARRVDAIKSDENQIINRNLAGFKTQTEMKWYLASLGFRVIPYYLEINGRMHKTIFDKDCGYITDIETGEQRTIFYNDLFRATA